ncbi:MAG TPA: DUF3054 domain-containing protein [Ktedonobacterales bacterium]|jgi:hypothetical protein
MTTDVSSESSSAPVAQPRKGVPWRVVALVAGDVASFLLFAAVGRRTHDEASGITALLQVAETALPFALGWFVVSPFVGAFRRSKTTGPWRMLARTELAWLLAWPVTLLLRWAIAPDHYVPFPFAIVILLANALFLGLWRTAFALIERWRSR